MDGAAEGVVKEDFMLTALFPRLFYDPYKAALLHKNKMAAGGTAIGSRHSAAATAAAATSSQSGALTARGSAATAKSTGGVASGSQTARAGSSAGGGMATPPPPPHLVSRRVRRVVGSIVGIAVDPNAVLSESMDVADSAPSAVTGGGGGGGGHGLGAGSFGGGGGSPGSFGLSGLAGLSRRLSMAGPAANPHDMTTDDLFRRVATFGPTLPKDVFMRWVIAFLTEPASQQPLLPPAAPASPPATAAPGSAAAAAGLLGLLSLDNERKGDSEKERAATHARKLRERRESTAELLWYFVPVRKDVRDVPEALAPITQPSAGSGPFAGGVGVSGPASRRGSIGSDEGLASALLRKERVMSAASARDRTSALADKFFAGARDAAERAIASARKGIDERETGEVLRVLRWAFAPPATSDEDAQIAFFFERADGRQVAD
jgi:hypothetical protein